MASRAVSYWWSVASRAGELRRLSTAATAPRMKPAPSTIADPADYHHSFYSKGFKGEYVPVYVTLGLIVLSTTLGLVTAKQQLFYHPSVRVNKKRREKVTEVLEPERATSEADNFINKSLFRRVAHAQDFDAVRAGITDPTRGETIHQPRKVESLKSVGVDPSSLATE